MKTFVVLKKNLEKVRDAIDNFDQRLVNRFCEDFIPMQQIEAMPALAVVSPLFKKNKDSDCVQLNSGVSLTYKDKVSKATINYLPTSLLYQPNTLPVFSQTNPESQARNLKHIRFGKFLSVPMFLSQYTAFWAQDIQWTILPHKA